MRYALLVLTHDRPSDMEISDLLAPYKSGGLKIHVDVTDEARESQEEDSSANGLPVQEYLERKGWQVGDVEQSSVNVYIDGSLMLNSSKFAVNGTAYAVATSHPVTHSAHRIGGRFHDRLGVPNQSTPLRFSEVRTGAASLASEAVRRNWAEMTGVLHGNADALRAANLRYEAIEAWRSQDEVMDLRSFAEAKYPSITAGQLSYICDTNGYSIPASFGERDFYSRGRVTIDAALIHGLWADEFGCHPRLRDEWLSWIGGFSFRQGGCDLAISHCRSSDWLTIVEADTQVQQKMRMRREYPRFKDF